MIMFVFLIIFCLSLNIIIIKKSNFFEKLNVSYNPVQKIHLGYVPRIGGIVVIITFYICLIMDKTESLFLNIELLIASFLILAVGSIEDLFGKASPALRFFAIFFGSLIFVFSQNTLPVIDVPIIGDILSKYSFINILFYTIGLTALSNGFNMIDGMNGLVGLTSLGCLTAILTLMHFIIGENIFYKEIIFLFLSLLIFLIFNFPLGKIFFGDTGSYWIGWVIGIITIKIYTIYDLNTWGALLILFYPLQEVVFSSIRKIIQKKSPLSPDIEHLHLKLYFLLKGSHERGIKFNSFVTVCLMPFWFIPCVMILWSQLYAHISILFLLILEITYLYYYFSIPKVKN